MKIKTDSPLELADATTNALTMTVSGQRAVSRGRLPCLRDKTIDTEREPIYLVLLDIFPDVSRPHCNEESRYYTVPAVTIDRKCWAQTEISADDLMLINGVIVSPWGWYMGCSTPRQGRTGNIQPGTLLATIPAGIPIIIENRDTVGIGFNIYGTMSILPAD